MKNRFLIAAAAAVVISAAFTAQSQNAGAANPPKKKLLVVTHTTGFRHSSIPTAEKVLKTIGEQSGDYAVEYCRNGEDVKKMLTPAWLNENKIDGVFFANTTGNLGIPDLKAFLDWIATGKGFAGAHSAGDTYHPQDAGGDTGYIDLVACEFKTHGAQAEAECHVEDPKHPAVAHLAPVYKVLDEIYHYKVNNRAKVHVLLALKKQPNDNVKGEGGVDMNGKPNDMLIAWNKMHGKGKVFYTALGHREDVWESEAYQKHILGGIRWTLGLARGDAKPQSAAPPGSR